MIGYEALTFARAVTASPGAQSNTRCPGPLVVKPLMEELARVSRNAKEQDGRGNGGHPLGGTRTQQGLSR